MTLKLNLGCGRNILEGWTNIDLQPGPGVNLIENLDYLGPAHENPFPAELPFENDVADEFLLSHVIEHISMPLDLMGELWRIAKPDARMVIRVPYGSSNDAYEDPTHVRNYFTGSFAYFAQPTYWRADYGYSGDWQAERITLSLDERRYGLVSREQMLGEITGYRNVVLEMVCELRAVKPRRAQDKALQVAPDVSIVLVDAEGRSVREA